MRVLWIVISLIERVIMCTCTDKIIVIIIPFCVLFLSYSWLIVRCLHCCKTHDTNYNGESFTFSIDGTSPITILTGPPPINLVYFAIILIESKRHQILRKKAMAGEIKMSINVILLIILGLNRQTAGEWFDKENELADKKVILLVWYKTRPTFLMEKPVVMKYVEFKDAFSRLLYMMHWICSLEFWPK